LCDRVHAKEREEEKAVRPIMASWFRLPSSGGQPGLPCEQVTATHTVREATHYIKKSEKGGMGGARLATKRGKKGRVKNKGMTHLACESNKEGEGGRHPAISAKLIL